MSRCNYCSMWVCLTHEVGSFLVFHLLVCNASCTKFFGYAYVFSFCNGSDIMHKASYPLAREIMPSCFTLPSCLPPSCLDTCHFDLAKGLGPLAIAIRHCKMMIRISLWTGGTKPLPLKALTP